jgi:transcriptional regulator with XRE-family HTH domain
MRNDRTYKDFGDALWELKKANHDISYGQIARRTGILEATVTALANRRRANPPDDEIMKTLADFFHVKPEYFYEWRLKKFLEFVNEHRDFLDHCEKVKKGYTPVAKREEPTPLPKDEREKLRYNTDDPIMPKKQAPGSAEGEPEETADEPTDESA